MGRTSKCVIILVSTNISSNVVNIRFNWCSPVHNDVHTTVQCYTAKDEHMCDSNFIRFCLGCRLCIDVINMHHSPRLCSWTTAAWATAAAVFTEYWGLKTEDWGLQTFSKWKINSPLLLASLLCYLVLSTLAADKQGSKITECTSVWHPGGWLRIHTTCVLYASVVFFCV